MPLPAFGERVIGYVRKPGGTFPPREYLEVCFRPAEMRFAGTAERCVSPAMPCDVAVAFRYRAFPQERMIRKNKKIGVKSPIIPHLSSKVAIFTFRNEGGGSVRRAGANFVLRYRNRMQALPFRGVAYWSDGWIA